MGEETERELIEQGQGQAASLDRLGDAVAALSERQTTVEKSLDELRVGIRETETRITPLEIAAARKAKTAAEGRRLLVRTAAGPTGPEVELWVRLPSPPPVVRKLVGRAVVLVLGGLVVWLLSVVGVDPAKLIEQ